MTDRAAAVADLVDEIAAHDGVADAWTAKSFTDRLVVVEVPPDATLPDDVAATLEANGCRGADEVYAVEDARDAAYAGELGDGRRYRFVDLESRGEMQSYVVD